MWIYHRRYKDLKKTMEYLITGEIHAHPGPIRACCIGPLGEVITGCQADAPCIRRWLIRPDSTFEEIGDPIFHDHWVTALTARRSSEHDCFPEGCIVTGCMDSNIRVYDPQGNPIALLSGHSKGVISLSWTSSGNLISGSWDGSAKIWQFASRVDPSLPTGANTTVTGSCIATLGPMENGVHVLGLSSDIVATTSTGESVNEKPANFYVRLYSAITGQQIVGKLADHAGSIRSLARVPGLGCDGFVTSSNDGSLNLRSTQGQVVGSMYHQCQEDGSPPFILDCTCIETESGMRVVSSGEDGSLMIWEATEPVQSIPHPTCVWCVCSLTDDRSGDFVSGGHDGKLRIFSNSSDRIVSSTDSIQLQESLIEAVSESAAKRRKGPSEEEIAKAPKWENRDVNRGTSEGQVMVFNKSGSMIAAQWESQSSSWLEIGEVTGTGDGGVVDGVHYDHVMPVEMETGSGGEVRTYSLGYNNAESPYDAAQRFIDNNGLPGHYLRQIADWIVSRTKKQPTTIDMSGSSSSSSSSSSSNANQSKPLVHLPMKIAFVFEEIPNGFSTKIMTKIRELNASSIQDNRLSDVVLGEVENIVKTLANTSYYHSSTISRNELNSLFQMANWPESNMFPMFDIFRLASIHPNGSTVLGTHPALMQQLLSTIIRVSSHDTTPRPTCLTAIRFLANTCKYEHVASVVLRDANLDSLLLSLVFQTKLRGSSSSHTSSAPSTNTTFNKSIRLAVASTLANISLSSARLGASVVSVDCLRSILLCIHELLLIESQKLRSNTEIVFRLLLAVGNCLVFAISNNSFKASIKSTDLPTNFASLIGPLSNSSVGSNWGAGSGIELSLVLIETAKEVRQLLTQLIVNKD